MLNDLVHSLNWIGLAASTTSWLCAMDVVLTGHKLITYVHAVVDVTRDVATVLDVAGGFAIVPDVVAGVEQVL
ncbi:hypothetical protein TIFTF001_052614 [Ficus carica]|uniref:Uncharacterized protein n=1 Tax=Ficus carica TaxID=3494 RepID=A0AA88JBT3_FICCA|nr:hypothetical protein TIFTF001_052614 [Ficus carica]